MMAPLGACGGSGEMRGSVLQNLAHISLKGAKSARRPVMCALFDMREIRAQVVCGVERDVYERLKGAKSAKSARESRVREICVT